MSNNDKFLKQLEQVDSTYVFTADEKNKIVGRALDTLNSVYDDLNDWEKDFISDMEIRHRKNQPMSEKQIRKLMEMYKDYI